MRADHILPLVPLITGIALGLAVYWAAVESGGDAPVEPQTSATPSEGPVSDEDSATPHPEVQEAIDAVEEDAAKTEFVGPIGEFIVSGREALNNYPCVEYPYRVDAETASESELAVGADALQGDEAAACDETVYSVSGYRSIDDLRAADVYRFYFSGDNLRVPISAPLDRIQIIDVAGRSGVIETARQELFPECRLFLIERYPTDSDPGIAWEISGTISCSEAANLGQELLQEVEANQ